jgi:hypothetical protein
VSKAKDKRATLTRGSSVELEGVRVELEGVRVELERGPGGVIKTTRQTHVMIAAIAKTTNPPITKFQT